MDGIAARLINEFGLKPFQVQNTLQLIDDGNTIPFIARYRKEMTGELDDQTLRKLHERLLYLRNLEARREEVRKLIIEQGRLDENIGRMLDKAVTLQEIEDIYRPFKPKRKTRASVAREKGLEPLAEIFLRQDIYKGTVEELAAPFVNGSKGAGSIQEAVESAQDILAEGISENADYRKGIRSIFIKTGFLVSKASKSEDSVYRMYYDFREAVAGIPGHRVLAVNRGEREEYLDVKLEAAEDQVLGFLKPRVLKAKRSVTSPCVEQAVEDSYKRLIYPSMEREIRNELTETAQEQAIKVFASNLRGLLLQPPVKGMTVLGLDPAYRTGCKLAVVNETGKVLQVGVIYPTPPQNRVDEAKKTVKDLIDRYGVDVISIGNGTASRESELFVSDLLKELDRKVYYVIVNEAGASVYSASSLGAEEFPELDVSLRSAASIARRLQDPLAELVKIDPKAIGVGQYQHDMNQKKLGEALGAVVEDCVNSVGVDLNTASVSLLSYISGINAAIARNIVEYRETHGRFTKRQELKKVPKLGPRAFEQCAGFLRIPGASNLLDNTSVHPESYDAAEKLLKVLGYRPEEGQKLQKFGEQAAERGWEDLAQKVGVGVPTLRDIVNELVKPGRDPRDELPPPILMSDVLEMKDLKPGMVLSGTVRNVADFGAFVDIGVHQDGLVHISELSDRFIRKPMEAVSVGDIVKVRVLEVDIQRKRIALSMKKI